MSVTTTQTAPPPVHHTPAATPLRTEPTITARHPGSRSVWRSPLVLAGYGVTGALVLALAGTGGATLTYNDRYQDAAYRAEVGRYYTSSGSGGRATVGLTREPPDEAEDAEA